MKKIDPFEGMTMYDKEDNDCKVRFHTKTKDDPEFWPEKHWRVEGGLLGEGFALDFALSEGLVRTEK